MKYPLLKIGRYHHTRSGNSREASKRDRSRKARIAYGCSRIPTQTLDKHRRGNSSIRDHTLPGYYNLVIVSKYSIFGTYIGHSLSIIGSDWLEYSCTHPLRLDPVGANFCPRTCFDRRSRFLNIPSRSARIHLHPIWFHKSSRIWTPTWKFFPVHLNMDYNCDIYK